jgi:hypothetical protein
MGLRRWKRTESRVVRPFVDIRECLADCEIKVGRERDFTADEAIQITDIDMRNPEISLKIPLSIEEIAERSGLASERISLVIVVNDLKGKKSEICFATNIRDTDEEIILLGEETLSQFSWSGRTQIEVALVLSEGIPFESGKPFLAGHWIAKKSFMLNAAKEIPSFPIEPMKGEDFKTRWGLPVDTVYFVDFYRDNLDIPHEELGSSLKIYINESVYNALIRAENTSPAKLIQNMLVSEIISCILARALNSFDGTVPERGNVLDGLVSKIKDSTGKDFQTMRDWAKDAGYPSLRALVQSHVDLCRSFLTCSFKGE